MQKTSEKLLDNEILLKHHKELGRFLPLDALSAYLKRSQNDDGSFGFKIINIEELYYLAGLAHLAGEGLRQDIRQALMDCRCGNLGFSQSPGQIPWLHWTYLASSIISWFDIRIEDRENMIQKILNLSIGDSHYCYLDNSSRDFHHTSLSIMTLSNLGYIHSSPMKLKETLVNCMDYGSITQVHEYLSCLQCLGIKAESGEIAELKRIVSNHESKDTKEAFEITDSRRMLGLPARKIDFQMEASLKGYHYAARIFNILGDTYRVRELYSIYSNRESEAHGTRTNLILNTFGFSVVKQIGMEESINKERFLDWLDSRRCDEGWPRLPGEKEFGDYTSSALFLLLPCREIKCAGHILRRADMDLDIALKSLPEDSYHLRSIKWSLEKMALLDSRPHEAARIIEKIMGFYRGGGFGPVIPYSYATLWGIRSLHLMSMIDNETASNIIKAKNKDIERFIDALYSEGGYSAIPGEAPDMQSTYCSLYSLWMIGSKPKNTKNTFNWILSKKNNQGCFSARTGIEPDILMTYYAVSSLILCINR